MTSPAIAAAVDVLRTPEARDRWVTELVDRWQARDKETR